MYTIAGATGRVGSAAAECLLAQGAEVRVLVRDGGRGEGWWHRGAEVCVTDLRDRSGLAAALAGSSGFFALLPFDLTASDIEGDQRRLIASITGAVKDAGVPHVTMLSSLGAELAEGTGPIRWLHQLECGLRETGAAVTAVRPGHFQEKVRDVLAFARAVEMYPVFASSPDEPVPMVATRDVGAVVAEALASPPSAHQVIDVEGPEYSERRVAQELGRALGKPLTVAKIPRPDWEGALMDAGLSQVAADLVAELYDADAWGMLRPTGDRYVRGRTPLERTLRDLVGVGQAA